MLCISNGRGDDPCGQFRARSMSGVVGSGRYAGALLTIRRVVESRARIPFPIIGLVVAVNGIAVFTLSVLVVGSGLNVRVVRVG